MYAIFFHRLIRVCSMFFFHLSLCDFNLAEYTLKVSYVEIYMEKVSTLTVLILYL